MMSEFTLDTYLDMPDDDDMPPLVDRPMLLDHPPLPPPPTMAMMSYSLDADFTPIPYSPDSPTTDMVFEQSAHRFELISEEDAPRISATKPSHAKKRDAGHIPRPPNAFILFRSSFIKSESVPGNIEGNHSTLSKIIGIVWKTLPPAERQLWEKRAVQAQAEHRARYPDWRFRPGTNVDAIAKRKTKDKNKDRPPSRRKRNASTRDKDKALATACPSAGSSDGGGGGGNRGGARCKKARGGLIQERRCAQIAELLTRGVKGVALTSAVQAWDKESGVSNVTDGVFVSEQGVGVDAGPDADTDATSSRGRKRKMTMETTQTTAKAPKTRSASSVQEARFASCNVALTDMYRRATSAPLAPDHGAIAPASPTSASTHTTFPTSVSPVPDFYPPPLSPASSVSYGSEVSFPDSDNMSVLPMFDLVPFSPPGSPCSSNLDNNDIAALGSVRSPSLGIPSANPASAAPSPPQAGQGPDAASLQHFFSSYSTLCDWAGGGGTMTHTSAGAGMLHHGSNGHHAAPANAKVVLPPLSLPYGPFGGDPYSFLHAPAVAINPWNDEQDLVDRPLFGGLDDPWRAVATTTGPYTC